MKWSPADMVFLPIVVRELRTAARQPRTYYVRMVVGVIWGAIAAYVLLATSIMGIGKYDGLMLFSTVSGALFGWAIISSWAGCDSISVEKREGTIGFLFLTDLKSHDIVLGKLVAAALPSFYGILTALPLMSICLLMGGVTIGQYAMTGLAILNIFFLGQAVGIFSSALCRARGNATGVPFLVLLLYGAAFALAANLARLKGWSWPGILFQYINPARPFYLAMKVSSRMAIGPGYWACLVMSHVQAWIFLGLAAWVLPRRWRDKPAKTEFWKKTWERWRYGNLAARTAFRRRLVSINPFLWLVCRRLFSPAFNWTWMAIVVVLMAILSSGAGFYEERFMFIIIFLQLWLRLGVPSHASLLEGHRASGSLEIMLCCSPMSVDEILEGMWLVVRRYYFWPTLVVVGIQTVMFIITLIIELHHSLDIGLPCFMGISIILLLADLRAMAWMAIWIAMSNPKPRSAGPTAFAWCTIMPWFWVAVCYATQWIRSEVWLWILWPTFALTNDVIVSRIAKDRLRKYFRVWASPSYVQTMGFWGRVGRGSGKLRRRLMRPNVNS